MAVKTFAAISIGSAVTEMKVFEYSSRKTMKEIDWIGTRLNLGLDAYTTGRISRKNVENLCDVLRDFKQIMNGYRITEYRACATSAFRESRNMLILKDYIEKQTGMRAEKLPSTSPANAAWSLERLIKAWKIILEQ